MVVVGVNNGPLLASRSGRDPSSVCSDALSDEITVVVVAAAAADSDDRILAFVVDTATGADAIVVVDVGDEERVDDGIEVSLTDGVVTVKATGIWKSFAVRPATILIGAYENEREDASEGWLKIRWSAKRREIGTMLTTCWMSRARTESSSSGLTGVSGGARTLRIRAEMYLLGRLDGSSATMLTKCRWTVRISVLFFFSAAEVCFLFNGCRLSDYLSLSLAERKCEPVKSSELRRSDKMMRRGERERKASKFESASVEMVNDDVRKILSLSSTSLFFH